jgi:hypothetical protein
VFLLLLCFCCCGLLLWFVVVFLFAVRLAIRLVDLHDDHRSHRPDQKSCLPLFLGRGENTFDKMQLEILWSLLRSAGIENHGNSKASAKRGHD